MDGDALVMRLDVTGAKLKLAQWDGEHLHRQPDAACPICSGGRGPGQLPAAFVQFQMDKDARLNVLRLSFDDGQAYEFTRE